MFNYGIVAIIFVLVGLLSILIVPVVLNRIFRWRFARRFELLVEQNHIIPILSRNVDTARPRSTQYKRVTMESFVDAWVSGQEPSSPRQWKPLAAAFVNCPDERPVTAAILTNEGQKAEAKRALRNFYNRRDISAKSKVQRDAFKAPEQEQQQQTIVHEDVAHTAGNLRFTTLILMPSRSHPRYQTTEAGASTAEKGVGRWTSTATPPRPYSRTLAEISDREAGGHRSSFGDTHGLRNLSAMEIGVSEHNLDQASDILDLVDNDDGDERASVVSLGNEDDMDEMIRILAMRTPVSRYPIMYGRR